MFSYTQKKVFYSLIAFTLLFSGCSDKNTIQLGFVGPLTGDASNYGIMYQNVIQMHAKKINDEGGINKKQIKVLYEDGKCNPQDANKAAQKLINIHNVPVILGGACSGETLAMAPIVERTKTLLISATSTSPDITNAGDFVFRTTPSDIGQAQVLKEFITNNKMDTIGMLVEQTDYALALAKTFEDKFSGKIIRKDFLPTEQDMKTLITTVNTKNTDAILFVVQSSTKAELALKQIKGLNIQKTIIGTEVFEGSKKYFKENQKFFKNNVFISTFQAPKSEKLTKFMTAYKKQYGETPPYPNYVSTILNSLDALFSTFAENKTTPEDIRDTLYENTFYGKVTDQKFTFDTNGDIENINHTVLQFNGENFISIE
jgi:branched-chain amino acid transport system substrate-binding protein